jgi:hypothetical protein
MTRKNIIARMVSSNNKIVSSRFFEQSQFEQMIMSLSFQSVSFSRKNDETFKILYCYQNFNLYVTLRRNRNRRTHLLNKYIRFFYWNNFSQINFRETPVETIRTRELLFSYIKILQVCSVLVQFFISGPTKIKYKF